MRFALLALLLTACGGQSHTYGELCDATGDAHCRRVVECGLGSYDACFQGFKTECCLAGNRCQDAPSGIAANTPAFEAACVPAMETQVCDEISAGTMPSACLMSH